MTSKAFAGIKDKDLIKTQAFIDGKWVDAKDGSVIKVINPGTDEELGTVPEMGIADTRDAIAAAAKALPAWAKTTAKDRHDILKKLYDIVYEHRDDIALITTLENGKPMYDSYIEHWYGSSFIEWFAEEAVRTYGEHIPSPFPGSRNVVIKQPIGVVAAMTPWNYPYAMVTRKVGPALAAGCTMVLKPAPETPYSALALVELARRAGVPDGVINVVTTHANVKEVGAELCENKLVKKITFTGSTAVAKLLYKQAAGTLKKISLEAGGNSPFIIFDDAIIDDAVEGVLASKFRGSGQTCVSANRIYVQSSVYDTFAERLAKKVAAFNVGEGIKEGVTQGPLIHSRAVDKVERHVNDAVTRGANVLVGGKRLDRPGSFFAPTVLSNVSSDAVVTREETFGPLAALIKFETEEEIIRLANNSDMGLGGYFYARDIGRAWRVAEALEVGMVGINMEMISQVYAPFGGVKESGFGREGAHGIEEYMNTKFIAFGGL